MWAKVRGLIVDWAYYKGIDPLINWAGGGRGRSPAPRGRPGAGPPPRGSASAGSRGAARRAGADRRLALIAGCAIRFMWLHAALEWLDYV